MAETICVSVAVSASSFWAGVMSVFLTSLAGSDQKSTQVRGVHCSCPQVCELSFIGGHQENLPITNRQSWASIGRVAVGRANVAARDPLNLHWRQIIVILFTERKELALE
jgi:hypothetical protein